MTPPRPQPGHPTAEPAAFVRNAADASQVKDARRRETDRATRERDDLLAFLAHPVGRRVLWRVLTHCQAFASVFDPAGSDSRTNYNAGRQDVGHWLLAEITHARPEALIEMMRENQPDA